MNRRIYLLLTMVVCFLMPQLLFAQEYEAPDYQLIKKQISNPSSDQYYPKLMERYQNCDTLLTNEDYRLLYYGFATREDYVPYLEKPQAFFDIQGKIIKPKAKAETFDEAIRICDEVLENNPFDLPAINLRSIALLLKGDSAQFNLNKTRLDALYEAITSSGDGETIESAFHIIDVEHEYEITSHLGLTVVKDSIVNKQVEYLRVEIPNGENINGIYFNFDACGSSYQKRYE